MFELFNFRANAMLCYILSNIFANQGD
uniref:Uncharacterized protein n=1 Tax=Rhizophora mucronata TaxID=61149 RepID=A0A2P2PJC6_RHIMU